MVVWELLGVVKTSSDLPSYKKIECGYKTGVRKGTTFNRVVRKKDYWQSVGTEWIESDPVTG